MSLKDGNITIYIGPGPTIKRIHKILADYYDKSGRFLSLSRLSRYLIRQAIWNKSDNQIVKDLIEADG